MGPLLGPVLGPVAGGFLVESQSWRWVFWIMAIGGGVFGILLLFVGRETYAPILLERKAAAIRKETGNQDFRSKLANDLPPREIFVRAISRPLKMLFLSPIVGLMSLYIAINYGILYLFFTTITFVFEGQYKFSSGSVGLAYIGIGVGMIVVSQDPYRLAGESSLSERYDLPDFASNLSKAHQDLLSNMVADIYIRVWQSLVLYQTRSSRSSKPRAMSSLSTDYL